MLKNRILFSTIVLTVMILTTSVYSAEGDERILKAVAEAKKLIDNGDIQEAQDIFEELRADFPKIIRPDLDLFIQGEQHFIKGEYTKAARSYEKLLTDHPKSALSDAALDREFTIAKAYLAGRKKKVFGFLKLSGYAEGIRIMEKITDRVGLDSPMGIEASVAVAQNYEDRQLYEDAYLKWWEISLHWNEGPVGKQALLGMARTKLAAYNKPPESKRHLYDASGLSTAKSCYSRFKLLYPVDARKIDVDKILKEIDEELAYKQLRIGQYYQYSGYPKAANLYYHMVANDWPATRAGQTAKELLAAEPDNASDDQTSSEK